MRKFVNFLREANHLDRHTPLAGVEFCGERFVAATNQNELQGDLRGVEAAGDVKHHLGAVAAEEDDCSSQIGAQAKLFAQRDGIGIVRRVEIRSQDHAGGAEDVRGVVAERTSLLRGALGSGNNVLLLYRLNPKARREIGKVGDQGDKRPARINLAPTLAEFAIEMRNDRNEQVGGLFAPELFEQAHDLAMEGADGHLQQA